MAKRSGTWSALEEYNYLHSTIVQAAMDFHIDTTIREACEKSGVEEDPAAFYRLAFNDAFQMGSEPWQIRRHGRRKSKGMVVKVPGVMEGFHTFGLWRKPDEYVFYVDRKEMWRTDAGGVSQVPDTSS